jgi:hypothetical protein
VREYRYEDTGTSVVVVVTDVYESASAGVSSPTLLAAKMLTAKLMSVVFILNLPAEMHSIPAQLPLNF